VLLFAFFCEKFNCNTVTEAVISGLKEQLQEKEEVLKNKNETEIQLQTTIDGLTNTV
jgi:hypothetical protein